MTDLTKTFPKPWADLLQALTMLAHNRTNDTRPFHCEHDPKENDMSLTDRILQVLARPEWRDDPPGSGVIAEVLNERRRDVMAALKVLEADGKVTDVGGNPHIAAAGWALTAKAGA